MSGPNAALSLPLGDRDEVPETTSVTPTPVAVAEREPGILPGLSLVIDECGKALDEAQLALAELNLARNQDNVALFKAAARRLASHTNHVARIANRYQPREAPKLNPTKE